MHGRKKQTATGRPAGRSEAMPGCIYSRIDDILYDHGRLIAAGSSARQEDRKTMYVVFSEDA